MKTIVFTSLLLLLGFLLHAQKEGTITYDETYKLEFEGLEGFDKDMLEGFPSSQSVQKSLFFKDGKSVYQTKKGGEAEDLEMSSDDGSFQIKIQMDDTEDIFFKDYSSKSTVHQKGLHGKSFVVSDDLKKHKWKITPEKVKYLGYECQKAVIEEDDSFIVAWFTSEIPVQIGPGSYHGLPGAILLLSIDEGQTEIKALSVDLNPVEEGMVAKPKKGKKVTEEEYKLIQEEKEKELQEMYGDKMIKIRN